MFSYIVFYVFQLKRHSAECPCKQIYPDERTTFSGNNFLTMKNNYFQENKTGQAAYPMWLVLSPKNNNINNE
jgi:hypothetical protein